MLEILLLCVAGLGLNASSNRSQATLLHLSAFQPLLQQFTCQLLLHAQHVETPQVPVSSCTCLRYCLHHKSGTLLLLLPPLLLVLLLLLVQVKLAYEAILQDEAGYRPPRPAQHQTPTMQKHTGMH